MIQATPKIILGVLFVLLSANLRAQSWQVPQPNPGLMPNPASGKTLFLQHCAVCHGPQLMGVDKGEKKGPPLLHKIYEPSHHSDMVFQLAVKNGVRAHHWSY